MKKIIFIIISIIFILKVNKKFEYINKLKKESMQKEIS
jgi:hypothetical protein